jgi:hypothetical protein
VVPHHLRDLPVERADAAVYRVLAPIADAASGRWWFRTVAVVCAVALFLGICEEAWEVAFADSFSLPHLVTEVAFGTAFILYGARLLTCPEPKFAPGDALFLLLAIGVSVQEVLDFQDGHEWPHLALAAITPLAAAVYLLRCYTTDQDDRSTT